MNALFSRPHETTNRLKNAKWTCLLFSHLNGMCKTAAEITITKENNSTCWIYDALGDLGRLRRPRSLDAFLQKWSKTAKNFGITNNLATTCCKCAILYGKTRVKCITKRMPLCVNTCFSVYFINAFIFTVFYRVKSVFQECTKTHRFYRVNRVSGLRKDPEIDHKMGLGSLKTHVLPRY